MGKDEEEEDASERKHKGMQVDGAEVLDGPCSLRRQDHGKQKEDRHLIWFESSLFCTPRLSREPRVEAEISMLTGGDDD